MTLVDGRRAGVSFLFGTTLALTLGLLVLGAGVLASLLRPALTAVPFWDDLYTLIAIDVTTTRGRSPMLTTGDLMIFWRPLELLANHVLRPLDPVAFVPVKLLSLFLHVLKTAAIVLLVRRMLPSAPAWTPILAGAVALFHPIAVSAVVQIDTVSESIAAAAIAWALWLTITAVRDEGRGRRGRLLLVIALSLIAVLGKESAAPAVAAMPIVGFVAATDRRRMWPDLLGLTLALGVVGLAFLAARHGLGFTKPQTIEARYEIGLGVNVLRNLATVFGALLFSGNTVSLIANRSAPAAIGFLPIVLAAGLVVTAFLRNGWHALAGLDARAMLASAVMVLAAVAAPALAPMISEHNAALPSAALLPPIFALTIAAAMSLGMGGRRIAAGAAVLAVAFGATAMRDKAEATAQIAHLAGSTRTSLARLLVTQDRVVVCITPVEGRTYSIYRWPADRWMPEEALWAQHTHPGKVVVTQPVSAGGSCDLSVPNYP